MAKRSETADLVPTGSAIVIEADAEQIAAMPTERLRQELTRGLQITAHNLLRLAMIVKALEDRGEDLSDLRVGMLAHLRRIAYGQTTAEVVVRFSGFPSLIGIIANLPMPDQQRLGAGEPVKLLVRGSNGPEHRLVDPLALSREQARQVFARDHIRDESEQIVWLESPRNQPTKESRPRYRELGRHRVDIERQGLVVNRTFVPLEVLVQALAELRGQPPEINDNEEMVAVPVKLTPAEHTTLKVRAARRGRDSSMIGLIRDALWASGLLAPES